MFGFEKFRDEKLREYRKAKSRGEVDEDIIPLLDLINSVPDFVTLSSCSGRIAVMDIPDFGDKRCAKFLGKWHGKVDVEDARKAIEAGCNTVWLIQFPPIIHVACSNLESARDLLKIANESGFRRSGVISIRKLVVEIASLERMELPVARNGKMIVSSEYLKFVVDLSNEKLAEGKRRLKRFSSAFGDYIQRRS